MSGIINVMLIEPGTRVVLANGATVEVVSNPRDGVWLHARYVASPGDPSLVGSEEMVFAQDVAEVVQ